MRRLIRELIWGKNNFFNSLIAIGVVTAIALGCKCGKDLDLSNIGKSNDSNKTVVNTDTTPEKTPIENTLSDESRGDVPSEREMEKLTKATLLDFNDAIQGGDFTDFHSKISSVWKKTSTPETFNQGFKEFIDKKIDISDVKNKNGVFDPQPTVKRKSGYKVLSAKGRYESSPLPTRFETEYIEEDGDWKLISIRVDTRK
ncbi:MAG: hypothetical protein ACR2F2_00375 [Pyrinomonadaceae bacterium]